ncbi:MAG: single-stranded DNA-binding protein [Gammaproteobacteria bacterium]|nr:single-stranded DNA-binding protein [Gammaproteobacteria bacterium]MDE0442925.1 single-stranded DNA-binding protein [Gammaproteobacteria bacterium]
MPVSSRLRERMPTTPTAPETIARTLGRAADRCRFDPPVRHVYNPLVYAFEAHRQYLLRYCRREAEILLLGMNPGPFGMVQTGVPFGEVNAVTDWLGIREGVASPKDQHAKRPIEGFECARREISGQRLWGWAGDRFRTPDAFFRRFFIWNYCPLAFLEETGRNRTPDKLPRPEREPLFEACDRALAKIVDYQQPKLVLGVGRFGEACARRVLRGNDIRIGHILHPSPASPAANRGWAEQVEKQLADLGIALP